jgi:hypothetical protein
MSTVTGWVTMSLSPAQQDDFDKESSVTAIIENDNWFDDLSFDAKGVAGAWFGMMVPGKGELTFQLQQGKPSERAQAALDELVTKDLISVEAFNRYGGLVYRPLVRFDAAFKWLGEQVDNPDIKFPLIETVKDEKDARQHQKKALAVGG